MELMCPSVTKSLRTGSGCHQSCSWSFFKWKIVGLCNINQQIPVSYWLLSIHLMISKGLWAAFRLFLHMRKKDYILPPAFHKSCLFVVSKLSLVFAYCSSIPVNPISAQSFVSAKLSLFSETVSVKHL